MVQIVPKTEVLQTLQQGEQIVFATRPSRLGQLFWYAIIVGLLLGSLVFGGIKDGFFWWMLLVGAILLVIPEINVKKASYFFTNYKIVIEEGIINKTWTHIAYNMITDVRVKKDIFERILGIGDIVVNTAGSTAYEGSITDINDPEAVERFLLSKIKR